MFFYYRGRGLDPVEVSPQELAYFFFLRDKYLSVSAIRGYHSALGQAIGIKGLDLLTSKELAMLFWSFSPPRERGQASSVGCFLGLGVSE